MSVVQNTKQPFCYT